MIGDIFKNLKNNYREIAVSERDIDKKWQLLSDILPEQSLAGNSDNYMPYGIAFAGIFIIFLLATVVILAQSANPGNLLYPVHTITEDLQKGLSGFIPGESHVSPPTINTPVITHKKLPVATPDAKNGSTSENSQQQIHGSKVVPTSKVLGTHTDTESTHKQFQTSGHGKTTESSDNHFINHTSHGNNGNSHGNNNNNDN